MNPFKILTLHGAQRASTPTHTHIHTQTHIVFHLKITFHLSTLCHLTFSNIRQVNGCDAVHPTWTMQPFCHGNGVRYKLSLLIINALCSDQAGITFNEIKCERSAESFFFFVRIHLVVAAPLRYGRKWHNEWMSIEHSVWICAGMRGCWVFRVFRRRDSFSLALSWLLKCTQCSQHLKWN